MMHGSQWEFTGIYQHVARGANRAARTILREKLDAGPKVAKQENKRVIFLGNFNASPLDGRRGYAKWSGATKEDKAMDAWRYIAGLIDILSRAP